MSKVRVLPAYNPSSIESKWRSFWEKHGVNKTDLQGAKRPFYNLMMYPYPSAEGLHIGNVYAFTGADIYGRYQRMKGNDVFEPIGFDSGGIHSENYAINVGVHPKIQIPKNIKHFKKQLHQIGCMYDWDHTVDVMDPAYYKWTQWLFIQLFKAGLAYKKKASVTWCPSCKTTLSDEQTERKIKNQKSTHSTSSGLMLSEVEASKIKNTIQNLKLDNDKNEYITVCERCKTPIVKKELEQWFFRITQYAERLLQNTYKLDWTEKVLLAQRNWLGKSEGAEVKFQIPNSKFQIPVFTTRPDTLYGCTFMCVSPEYPQLDQLVKSSQKKAVEEYIKKARNKSEMERKAEDKDKTGVFSGSYAVNPVNAEKLPIYVADYVLLEYGSGAVMGVPMHDKRDFLFAKKYKLTLKTVVIPDQNSKLKIKNEKLQLKNQKECYEGPGVLVNSGDWNGWRYPQDLNKVIQWLEDKKIGKKAVQYKLRDWCISRQRYWGPPIPMVFCPKCTKEGRSGKWEVGSGIQEVRSAKEESGKSKNQNIKNSISRISHFSLHTSNMAGWFPVPEEQLPVLLPDTDDYLPGEAGGKSPLARVPEFVKTTCPACGGSARRETDVSDTFLDSSWYFLRYPSVKIQNYNVKLKKNESREIEAPWDEAITRKWLPVSQYTGGAEHSVLHLLYSRFITMALHDMGFLDFEEPFPHFYAHGLIIKDGAKMSKSRGNIVNPDAYIAKLGADALRCYLIFLGPFSAGGDFRDRGVVGMYRFLTRVYRLCQEKIKNQKSKCKMTIQNSKMSELNSKEESYWVNKTIKKVGEDIEHFKYNTAIAAIMQLVNFLSDQKQASPKSLKSLILVLAPFAPYMTEELYQSQKSKVKSQKFNSVHQESWPQYDPGSLREEMVTIVVQVNGKLRDKFKVQSSKLKVKNEIIELARESERIKHFLAGRAIRQTIFVPGKLINFVI